MHLRRVRVVTTCALPTKSAPCWGAGGRDVSTFVRESKKSSSAADRYVRSAHVGQAWSTRSAQPPSLRARHRKGAKKNGKEKSPPKREGAVGAPALCTLSALTRSGKTRTVALAFCPQGQSGPASACGHPSSGHGALGQARRLAVPEAPPDSRDLRVHLLLAVELL